jgi:COP9 signalosome complex subunit 6
MASGAPPSKSSAVLEKEGGGGALQIDLHPLVIINISDHFTRAKVESNATPAPRVIGALLGVQDGRKIEISNSFELVYHTLEGSIVVDKDYLKLKQEQFKKVFPTNDFLGWYSTSSGVAVSDIAIHKQFLEINESPIYLVLDAVAAFQATTRDLPITVFESELHVVQDQPTMLFVKVPYRIQTGEAERIGVDHVARVTPAGGAEGSQLTSHLVGLNNAVKMLNARVKTLHAFCAATQEGKIPTDHGILRQIASLVNVLPAIDTGVFSEDFIKEYNDVLLVTYLAGITKGTSAINDLVEKYNITYERHTRRRGYM